MCGKLRICSHLLKKSQTGKFVFCSMQSIIHNHDCLSTMLVYASYLGAFVVIYISAINNANQWVVPILQLEFWRSYENPVVKTLMFLFTLAHKF